MKRHLVETSIMSRRGPARVVTYGYDTKINGIDVIQTVDRDTKEFTPVHRNSGLSIAVYFTSATRAVKFANKHLKGFDFTQDKDDLLRDGKLSECVLNAKVREGL